MLRKRIWLASNWSRLAILSAGILGASVLLTGGQGVDSRSANTVRAANPGLAAAGLVSSPQVAANPAQVGAVPVARSGAESKVHIFFDPTIAGLGKALSRARPDTILHPLVGTNPFEQMADALAGHDGIREIHVFSHGEGGALKVEGRLFAMSGTNARLRGAFSRIRRSLAPGADILLYGCNIGQGKAGQQFVAALAGLTGANVAASPMETEFGRTAPGPALALRSGPIEARYIAPAGWEGRLWTTELWEGGWFGDLGIPSGAPLLHSLAAQNSGSRFSTMGPTTGSGPATTYSVVFTGGATAIKLINLITSPTSYAAAVTANNYFYANLVVGGTNGLAISSFSFNRVNANPAGAIMRMALYDTVTSTLTPVGPTMAISGFSGPSGQIVIPAPVGMVAGRAYQLRWYAYNCGPLRTCYIDNPSLWAKLNEAPSATNNTYSTASQTAVSGNFVTNTAADSDPELQTLTVDRINGAAFTVGSTIALAGGTLVITNANGAFTFTPAAGFSGAQTFTYRINDGFSLTASATVTINVAAAQVVATADGAAGIDGVSGASGVLNVFSNDTVSGAAAGPANAVLSVASGSSVPAGLTFNTATGSVSVLPGTAAGTYSFNYQICQSANPAICAVAAVTVTVRPAADLVITKSNGSSSVTSGQTTTYTLTVANSGPDAAVGPVVKDTIVSGLNCPTTNPVTIAGSGVPAGSFTVADLIGPGITLATLLNGQSATLTYSCQVN